MAEGCTNQHTVGWGYFIYMHKRGKDWISEHVTTMRKERGAGGEWGGGQRYLTSKYTNI